MPRPTQPVVVRHPQVKTAMVTLDPAVDYAADDVLVEAYPWAFEVKEVEAGAIVESVVIEKATAAPGEKRNRGGRKK